MTRREWEIVGVLILFFVFVVPFVAVCKIGRYVWWSVRDASA